jgi:crossover junction endodeoxyribonuclease RuvC
MTLILGIDPGSRRTGFGVIRRSGQRAEYISSGVIRIPTGSLPERLKVVFDGISEIIARHHPDEVAVENIFVAKSAGSALKLGQARGAAIVAATHQNLPVYEYEARKVKQSVVGHGAANKVQVQHMVKTLLKLSGDPQEDAADALAVALCHAHTQQGLVDLGEAGRFRRGRLR